MLLHKRSLHNLCVVLIGLMSCGLDDTQSPNPVMVSEQYSVAFTHNNGIYTREKAIADFGKIEGSWEEVNAEIVNETAKIRIPKETQSNTQNSPNGTGHGCNIDIPDGSAYELSYRIKFDPKFQWSRGGKCGFGFVIGKGLSGCSSNNLGVGASARIMWYNPTNQRDDKGTDTPYFQPYLYFADKQEDCGSNFGKKSIMLKKDTWYKVYIKIKSNTSSNNDGQILIQVDGITLLSKDDVRWTTTDTPNRLITKISWNTFRGGSQDYWASTSDGYIYYDDVSWKKLAD